VFEVDALGLLTREVLRERAADLVAESCAWAVGLSDRPWCVRRSGRVVAGGTTMGARAAGGQPLSGEEDARLELGEALPGSFADALGALTPDGRLYVELYDDAVLVPFVLATCLRAAERARRSLPRDWVELLEELGHEAPADQEDGTELLQVVRAAEWDVPLRTCAEQLVLAALGHVPLVEVEAEGLPLSLVRAAEAHTRAAVAAPDRRGVSDEDLAGALFLADMALRTAGLPRPVPPAHAGDLLRALVEEGLEPEEVLAVLPQLPVREDTAEQVARALAGDPGTPGR
jgi:hypothetical protein